MTVRESVSRVVVWGSAKRGFLDAVADALRDAGYAPERRVSDAGGERSADDCSSVAWVYLAADRGNGIRPDLADAREMLGAWRRADAGRLVVVASAAIWEPNWHHPGLATEGAAKTVRTGNPIAGAWRDLETLVEESGRVPDREVVILRPVPIVAAGDRGFWSRLLSRRVTAVVAGYDPPLQLLSVADFARTVLAAVRGDVRGTLHVGPSDTLSLRRVLAAAEVRALPIPWWILALGCRLGHRLGVSQSPAQVDYLRYSWTVSADRLRRASVLVACPTARTARREGRGRDSGEAVSGEAQHDPFGMDRAFIDGCGRTLFRWLERGYWRIETSGLEHVPAAGPVVLVGVHRGFMPFDAVMTLHVLARRTGRYPRFLIHPGLLKFPFLHDFFIRLGGVIACRENADTLLEQGEMVGVLPEGVHGPFRLYRDSYVLGKRWRADFVRFALRHGASILPWVTVGPAEMLPIVKRLDWRWWKRWAEWPFLPVTGTVLPIPLPSKWHTRFLPTIELADRYPAAAAEDHRLVEEISLDVRNRMQAELSDMAARRRSVFFGSLGDDEGSARRR